jgi:2-methylcitrate dehydratase PrpD
MAATQALRELMQDGVARDAIQDICVAVPPPHLKMIDHGVVLGDRASHLTSVQYQMALAAHRPDSAYDLAQSPRDLSPALRSFMARIEVEGDDKLLESYPGAWPAHISVTTPAGPRHADVMHVPGDPARPFDWPRVTEKFRRVVAPVVGPERAEAMPGRIVESLDDRQLLLRLVGDVTNICTGRSARP